MPEAAAVIERGRHSTVTVCRPMRVYSICVYLCVYVLKWAIGRRDDRIIGKEINCEKVRKCKGG